MTQTLNLYTMQTLFEQPVEPVDFIVEGLLAPGLYILGGSPKVGKSWLALQLCLAVCDGQRLHSRALHLPQTAPSGLYLCGQALPIGQGLEQQLEHTLDEHPDIRLVILDTLQKVRCVSGSGMSYGSDYQDAAALKSIADRYHVCLLAIHHLRKLPDDPAGERPAGRPERAQPAAHKCQYAHRPGCGCAHGGGPAGPRAAQHHLGHLQPCL